MEKKRLRQINALAEKLKALPHLDEAERVLYAQMLTATPDERWRLNVQFLRSVSSCRPSPPRKFASKSRG